LSGKTDKLVDLVDGDIVADSITVAKKFGREHKNVLRDIRDLIGKTRNSPHGTKLKFELREEIQRHSTGASKTTFYLMNREAFTLLVMGFDGDKAIEWKLKYIDAFDAMEGELKGRQPAPKSANEIIQQAMQLLTVAACKPIGISISQ
jgi:Rha family phage regulatory protein